MNARPLSSTTSLCTTCLRSVPAEIWEHDGRVELRKVCEEHGEQSVIIADSAAWYHDTLAHKGVFTAPTATTPIDQGCPFDCGACPQHQQRVELTIVPITSGCNLACPICYTHNRNDDAYHMPADAFSRILEVLSARDPHQRIINLTGGEPTVHPDWLGLLQRCHDHGIRRVTLSTHGLGLDDATLERLAALDTRVVLSFDSFDDATNAQMLGGAFTHGKLDVLERLGRFGVATTLLPVVAAGFNEHEIGRFVQLALHHDHIRSLELHTMTYTGQYGRSFEPRGRIPPDAVLRAIEAQTNGLLTVADFVPAPAAHPLCYQVAYLLQVGADWVPLTRWISRSELRSLLMDSLYLEPSPAVEAVLHRVMTDAWADGADPQLLRALKAFVDATFAPGQTARERMLASEGFVKAIYVHSHMDEATFDTDRIQQCCVGIAAPDGSNIPSCAYNVLYRNRDDRFTPHPAAPLSSLGPGRLP